MHVLGWENSLQSSGMCVFLAFVAEAADVCIRVHIGNPTPQKFALISLVCKISIDPYTFHNPGRKLSCIQSFASFGVSKQNVARVQL